MDLAARGCTICAAASRRGRAAIRRMYAVEREGLSWAPVGVRDGGTELLHVMFARTRFYDGIAAACVQAVAATGQRHFVDLWSGGGDGTT